MDDRKPYRFLGEDYKDNKNLVAAMAKCWDEGKKQLLRGFLTEYFKEYDIESAGYCMDAEDEIKDGQDEDIASFRALYKLDPSMKDFVWKGKKYENTDALGIDLLNCLRREDSSINDFIGDLLEKGVVSQYIEYLQKSDVRMLESIKSFESEYKWKNGYR